LEDGSVKANYISTQDQLADFLTKYFGREVSGAAVQDWDDPDWDHCVRLRGRI